MFLAGTGLNDSAPSLGPGPPGGSLKPSRCSVLFRFLCPGPTQATASDAAARLRVCFLRSFRFLSLCVEDEGRVVGVVEYWVYCVILAGVIFLCVRHLPAKHLDCRALLTGGGWHRLRDRLAWGGGYSRGLLISHHAKGQAPGRWAAAQISKQIPFRQFPWARLGMICRCQHRHGGGACLG